MTGAAVPGLKSYPLRQQCAGDILISVIIKDKTRENGGFAVFLR